MNFLRWLCFWPVSMTFGFVTSCTVLLLGGLLLGHWWFTGCLVIAASAFIQPVVITLLAANIVPRINKLAAWSILLPCLLMYLSAAYTLFALIFRGYEGDPNSVLFSSVSPWWTSLSYYLGWLYGFAVTWEIWEAFQEQQEFYDEYVEAQLFEATDSPSGGAAEAV